MGVVAACTMHIPRSQHNPTAREAQCTSYSTPARSHSGCSTCQGMEVAQAGKVAMRVETSGKVARVVAARVVRVVAAATVSVAAVRRVRVVTVRARVAVGTVRVVAARVVGARVRVVAVTM